MVAAACSLYCGETNLSKQIDGVLCSVKVDGTFGMEVYRNQTMNGARYHSLLQFTALPELEIRKGGNLNTQWWQQDGAPCHVTDHNMRYLDRKFEGRVVSRRAIRGHDWPARSPDLNPLDFFHWGFLKSQVYTPKPRDLNELKLALERAVARVDVDMCRRSVMDVRNRAEKCIANHGGHFE
jgi:hypothetical protein